MTSGNWLRNSLALRCSANEDGKATLELNVNVSDEEDATIHVVMDDIKPAIDSSSMSPSDWVLITARILQNYDGYAGIVVLHGTDTMAFSASAVSYMMGHGVSKPVIFTGSQVPLSKTRNDAQRNLITSLTIAATESDLTEVCLYFGTKLLRGNRSVKVSSSSFPAFSSPNFAPLGEVGIEITTYKPIMLSVNKEVSLADATHLQKRMIALQRVKTTVKEFSVVVITLHPGIRASFIKAALEHTQPPVKGVVLQAFGAGNAPADKELIGALKTAHDDNGVVIVDITQIVHGGVDLDAYESAAGLKLAGAISGYDRTGEADLTKLTALIAIGGLSQKELEDSMKEPFRGDLSRDFVQQNDAYWKELAKKRGPSKYDDGVR